MCTERIEIQSIVLFCFLYMLLPTFPLSCQFLFCSYAKVRPTPSSSSLCHYKSVWGRLVLSSWMRNASSGQICFEKLMIDSAIQEGFSPYHERKGGERTGMFSLHSLFV